MIRPTLALMELFELWPGHEQQVFMAWAVCAALYLRSKER